MEPLPKSYVTNPKELEGLTQNAIYFTEALFANKAEDGETAWKWLALAEIPAESLAACKEVLGANFIRKKRLNTRLADEKYGQGWLDTP